MIYVIPFHTNLRRVAQKIIEFIKFGHIWSLSMTSIICYNNSNMIGSFQIKLPAVVVIQIPSLLRQPYIILLNFSITKPRQENNNQGLIYSK